jgi:hypothetical protein
VSDLNPHDQKIYDKLAVEFDKRGLSIDELERIRKGLSMLESFGILSNMVIKAAAIIAAGAALLQYWPVRKP